jgi:hypothetical protein
MPTGRLIYVTGIPSTGVREGLRKFITWFAAEYSFLAAPHAFFIEDELQRLALPDVKRLVRSDVEQADIRHVLQLPKPVLTRLWPIAYKNTLAAAQEKLDLGHDVFLSFHACWYHQQTQAYISAVDFRVIQRASYVITFIDDIYDTFVRLSQPSGMFRFTRTTGPPVLDALIKLVLTINWREFEIVLSQRLATTFGDTQHVLCAVKHPHTTLYSLLFEQKPLVYLSHHITYLRDLRANKDSEGAAASLIDDIQEFAAVLRSKVTLFEPTTIDEGRFHSILLASKSDTTKLYLPALSRRWPFAAKTQYLLYDPPPQSPDEWPIFGIQWQKDALGYLDKQALSKQELAHIKTVSQLLEPLRELILRQINSRDHSLVEQSAVLVVYRPWMSGHTARGVGKEIKHQQDLRKDGDQRRFSIVVHSSVVDEEPRQRRAAQKYLLGLEKEANVRTRPDFAAKVTALNTDDNFWHGFNHADKSGAIELGSYLLTALEITYAQKGGRSALDLDNAALGWNAAERLAINIKTAMAADLKSLENESVEIISEPLSPSHAAQEVAKRIHVKWSLSSVT